jgi:hypothetical protein
VSKSADIPAREGAGRDAAGGFELHRRSQASGSEALALSPLPPSPGWEKDIPPGFLGTAMESDVVTNVRLVPLGHPRRRSAGGAD